MYHTISWLSNTLLKTDIFTYIYVFSNRWQYLLKHHSCTSSSVMNSHGNHFIVKLVYSHRAGYSLLYFRVSILEHLLSCRLYIFNLSVVLSTADTNHRHNHQKLPVISLVARWPLHRLLTTLLLSNKSKLLPARGRTAARQRQMEAPSCLSQTAISWWRHQIEIFSA